MFDHVCFFSQDTNILQKPPSFLEDINPKILPIFIHICCIEKIRNLRIDQSYTATWLLLRPGCSHDFLMRAPQPQGFFEIATVLGSEAPHGDGVKTYEITGWWFHTFFPTCQVRVVRFYVSCLLLSSSPLLLLLLNRDPRRTVFSVGPQPRPSTPSVPCRTSTTTIPAQCSLPDLNHDHPRPVFPAGPQPRVSTPSVPCRTSCRKIWDKECAEES